ncbi:hypothetical protein [Prauserella halophila]|nr:hypothetical protein [Prauserella halophila]MCP2237717.1 hypothetical protein [Prauserella halophila]
MTTDRAAGHAASTASGPAVDRDHSGDPVQHTAFAVRFRLSPDSLTWLVVRDGAVLSRHVRKRDAERLAAAHARGCRPSSVTIERMDGTEQTRRHYRQPRARGDVAVAVVAVAAAGNAAAVPRGGENSTLVTAPGPAYSASPDVDTAGTGTDTGTDTTADTTGPSRPLNRGFSLVERRVPVRAGTQAAGRRGWSGRVSRPCARGTRATNVRVVATTRLPGRSRTVETR